MNNKLSGYDRMIAAGILGLVIALAIPILQQITAPFAHAHAVASVHVAKR